MSSRRFVLRPVRIPERDLHEQIVRVLRLGLGSDVAWTCFPAGPHGTPKDGAKLKRLGLQSGWPDLLFIHNGQALFIELKAADGRISPSQVETHYRIITAGGKVATCNSVESVLQVLRNWQIPLSCRIA